MLKQALKDMKKACQDTLCGVCPFKKGCDTIMELNIGYGYPSMWTDDHIKRIATVIDKQLGTLESKSKPVTPETDSERLADLEYLLVCIGMSCYGNYKPGVSKTFHQHCERRCLANTQCEARTKRLKEV